MAATATIKPAIPAVSPTFLAPADQALSRMPSMSIRPSPISSSASSPTAGTPPSQPSLTSKEWVIPPRPKPGRKPATDTPPTKRKAQNRAAQRAFRERRAARVGELEEQIKQMEEEDEQEQNALRANIERLEREVEQYRTDLRIWIEKCRRLENELKSGQHMREFNGDSHSHSTDAIALPRRTSDKAHLNHNESSVPQEPSTDSVGCGNCTSATSCQCIEEAFNVLGASNDLHDFPNSKRPHSPFESDSHKRIKPEPHEGLEIDFTSSFPSRGEKSNVSTPEAGSLADPCGFCQDGTPCICAEMAAEDARERAAAASSLRNASTQQSSSTSLRPGTNQLSQFTPPPSEGDVATTPNTLPTSTANNSCASGPGSCAQCKTDPNSTVFCKALAASRSPSTATPTGCCGGSTAAGGCCQNQQTPSGRTTRSRKAPGSNSLKPTSTGVSQNLPSIRLTCADTYMTLSRHPAYARASGDIASWMPNLHANATPDNLAGRPAMEIDAANVMSVLKDFDRRFSS